MKFWIMKWAIKLCQTPLRWCWTNDFVTTASVLKSDIGMWCQNLSRRCETLFLVDHLMTSVSSQTDSNSHFFLAVFWVEFCVNLTRTSSDRNFPQNYYRTSNWDKKKLLNRFRELRSSNIFTDFKLDHLLRDLQFCWSQFSLEQGWATIFVRGPHCAFICV